MARWRAKAIQIEPPSWYRVFDPAAWDVPDEHEQTMMDGWRCIGEWPARLHGWHAERRWHQAKYEYRREHPALAEQEFIELTTRRYGRLV